tara:strand:+ start:294 stop:818 length:525 start_codon:yes stop_codon:yes gene_type:complete
MFFDHIKRLNFVPEIIIDVGVAGGTYDLYRAFPDAHYLMFEPLKAFEVKIKELLKNKVSGEYFNVALSDHIGMDPINANRNSLDGASIKLSNKTLDFGKFLREVKVDILDNYLDLFSIESPVLLKTDCQGADIDVLKGGESSLNYVDMLIIESQLFNTSGGSGEFYASKKFCTL